MTKKEFIKQIENNLKGFDKSEISEITSYNEEIIADKIESGLSEEEAVSSLGEIKKIRSEIKANLVYKRSSKKTPNTLKNFLIILGICSTPILLPLGITLEYFISRCISSLLRLFWPLVHLG